VLCATGAARAEEPARRQSDPERVSGVERQEREPGDFARKVGSIALFLPRAATELFFIASGTAAGLIEEEQVVPRVDEMLNPQPGEVHIFPTAFAETGTGVNVGGRVIGRSQNVASSVRAGYGGSHDLVAESKLRLSVPYPVPSAFSLEALHDERSSLGYLGLGQDPESDARNAFRPTTSARSGSYLEQRERFIASAGIRPLSDLELFVSSSLARRRVLDPADPSADSLADVFLPPSIPGAYATTQIVYSELAIRFDSRLTRGAPDTGFLLETYAGRADGIRETRTRFVRAGGRVAAFLELFAPSNVLSPKLVLDGLAPREGAVPFNELPRQPDYRGFDNRRDYVSAVGSLDYRWTLMRYLGARLFTDAATVAPRLSELRLEGLRWDAGFGLDVFSRSTELGSLAFSASPEGVRLLILFGVSPTFGDRQHRG
jgi:hypothetical protein